MTNQEHDIIPEDAFPAHYKAGYVAVLGRPNVGKSTLMNAYLGQKIAIVSDKPQTTRNRLLGILTQKDAQIIFVDTPGIHHSQHKLGEAMVETAIRSIPDADLVLFVVDGSRAPTQEDRMVAQAIQSRSGDIPVILVLNKIDLVASPADIDPQPYLSLLSPTTWLPISAARGDNKDRLLELIVEHLPFSPPYFPDDQVTDQNLRFIAAEMVREAALKHLRQEIPHALAVITEEFKERNENMTYISATLYVERESQKGIVIGQDGKTLKQIGRTARREIEDLVGTRVFLELWVKTRPKWRSKDDDLIQLGYR